MHIHRSPEAIAADRARYEEHQRKGLESAPKTLPPASACPPPPLDPARILRQEVIPGGWYWSCQIAAGEVLRIAPETLSSSVALVAWSAQDPSERMNLPDTVKLQWTTDLKRGRVIFSDMGRVMFSITEDSSGAHDALSGGSDAAQVAARWPEARGLRNTRDNLVLLAAKHGLSPRDLPAMLNLFTPVRVNSEDRLFWNPALLSGGDWVELRAEMDLIIGLSTCPHPLDPAEDYAPQTMIATRLAAQAVAEDDICRTATAEARRGFDNNARA